MEPLRLALSLAVAAAALAVGGYFAVLALNNPPKPGDPPGRDGKPKWHPVAYVTFPLIMAGLYFFETSLLALPLFDVVAVKLPYRAMFQNVSWSGHRRGCDTVVLRNAEAESFTFCVSTDLRLPLRRSKHILVVGTRSAFGIRAHQMLKQD